MRLGVDRWRFLQRSLCTLTRARYTLLYVLVLFLCLQLLDFLETSSVVTLPNLLTHTISSIHRGRCLFGFA